MDQRCTVCNHPSLPEIDRALMDGLALRPLADHYGLSASALSRHLKHLLHALAARRRHAEHTRTVSLLEKLELLEARLDRLFRQAESLHSLHISLGCVQESIRLLALRERIRHSLNGPPP